MIKKTLVILLPLFLVFTIITLGCASAYSSNVSISTTQSIGTIRSDFYGVNVQSTFAAGGNISDGMFCVLNVSADYNASRQNFTSVGLKLIRMDGDLEYNSNNDSTFNNESAGMAQRSVRYKSDVVKWAYENNVSISLICGYTPTWQQNRSSGYCKNTNFASCPPNNNTEFADTCLDLINNITESGLYNSTIKYVEVYNEPYSSLFMNNLTSDNVTKYTIYFDIWNQTRNYVIGTYPNMKVIMPSGNNYSSPVMMSEFTKNFSYLGNLVSNIHQYNSEVAYGGVYNYVKKMHETCVNNGVDCNQTLISEWNVGSNSFMNDTSNNLHSAQTYSDVLNYNPSNVNSVFYTWAYRYMNSSCSNSDYNYSMWSQFSGKLLYHGADITKLFATNHKAGNTVYNSSSTNTSLKVVSSKDTNGKWYIALTNTLTEGVNASLDTTISNVWMDIQSGQLYNKSLVELTSYDVKFVIVPNLTLSSAGLNKTNYLGEQIGALGSEVAIHSDITDIDTRTIKINSTLPIHNETVIISIECSKIYSVQYTPKNGTAITPTYTCTNNLATFTNIVINPSNDSNEFIFHIVEESCSSIISAYGDFGTWLGIVAMVVVIAVALGILGLAGKLNTEILIMGGLALTIGAIALILGIQLENYFCELG